KTAVAGQLARLAASERDVVVVAMGRGGPAEPEPAEAGPGPAELLERSRAGYHAASDYLEDAALAGVETIGCRRCGGGLAGVPVVPVLLRPRPAEPVEGRRAAVFTTAPAEAHEQIERWLRERHAVEVVSVSGNLADRAALRRDLSSLPEVDVYLVEVKAAALD